MPCQDYPEITHTFNRPGDPLFGVDPIKVKIPGDSFFTDALGVKTDGKRGMVQVTGKPSTNSVGEQMVYASWQLAPVPGSFITYHLNVCYQVFADAHGRVVVFGDRDFWGDSLVRDDKITYAELNAMGWNDKISSIDVLNGQWIFYSDDMSSPYVDSNNVAIVLGPGRYSWVEDEHIMNDTISSFRCVTPGR